MVVVAGSGGGGMCVWWREEGREEGRRREAGGRARPRRSAALCRALSPPRAHAYSAPRLRPAAPPARAPLQVHQARKKRAQLALISHLMAAYDNLIKVTKFHNFEVRGQNIYTRKIKHMGQEVRRRVRVAARASAASPCLSSLRATRARCPATPPPPRLPCPPPRRPPSWARR